MIKGKLNTGDKLLSKYGKLLEIMKKEGSAYVVRIECLDAEYKLPEEYILKECSLQNETETAVDLQNMLDSETELQQEESCADCCNSEEECTQECTKCCEPIDTVVAAAITDKKNSEVILVEPKERRTVRSVILGQLEQGPKTNDELAQAILEAGISKADDIKKIKTYVSINLSNLKKEGLKIERVARGKHQLVK